MSFIQSDKPSLIPTTNTESHTIKKKVPGSEAGVARPPVIGGIKAPKINKPIDPLSPLKMDPTQFQYDLKAQVLMEDTSSGKDNAFALLPDKQDEQQQTKQQVLTHIQNLGIDELSLYQKEIAPQAVLDARMIKEANTQAYGQELIQGLCQLETKQDNSKQIQNNEQEQARMQAWFHAQNMHTEVAQELKRQILKKVPASSQALAENIAADLVRYVDHTEKAAITESSSHTATPVLPAQQTQEPAPILPLRDKIDGMLKHMGIEDALFLVMMEATQDQEDDLRMMLGDMQARTKQKKALRDYQGYLQKCRTKFNELSLNEYQKRKAAGTLEPEQTLDAFRAQCRFPVGTQMFITQVGAGDTPPPIPTILPDRIECPMYQPTPEAIRNFDGSLGGDPALVQRLDRVGLAKIKEQWKNSGIQAPNEQFVADISTRYGLTEEQTQESFYAYAAGQGLKTLTEGAFVKFLEDRGLREILPAFNLKNVTPDAILALKEKGLSSESAFRFAEFGYLSGWLTDDNKINADVIAVWMTEHPNELAQFKQGQYPNNYDQTQIQLSKDNQNKALAFLKDAAPLIEAKTKEIEAAKNKAIADLEAAKKLKKEQEDKIKQGEIDAKEYDKKVADAKTNQVYNQAILNFSDLSKDDLEALLKCETSTQIQNSDVFKKLTTGLNAEQIKKLCGQINPVALKNTLKNGILYLMAEARSGLCKNFQGNVLSFCYSNIADSLCLYAVPEGNINTIIANNKNQPQLTQVLSSQVLKVISEWASGKQVQALWDSSNTYPRYDKSFDFVEVDQKWMDLAQIRINPIPKDCGAPYAGKSCIISPDDFDTLTDAMSRMKQEADSLHQSAQNSLLQQTKDSPDPASIKKPEDVKIDPASVVTDDKIKALTDRVLALDELLKNANSTVSGFKEICTDAFFQKQQKLMEDKQTRYLKQKQSTFKLEAQKVDQYLKQKQARDAYEETIKNPPPVTVRMSLGGLEDEINNAKNQSDSMADLNEQQQMRLQMINERRSKLFNTLSNLLKKFETSADNIIANIK